MQQYKYIYNIGIESGEYCLLYRVALGMHRAISCAEVKRTAGQQVLLLGFRTDMKCNSRTLKVILGFFFHQLSQFANL